MRRWKVFFAVLAVAVAVTVGYGWYAASSTGTVSAIGQMVALGVLCLVGGVGLLVGTLRRGDR